MYVNIEDPAELRRKFLLSIKKIVQNQKKHHEFKKLREQKFSLFKKLNYQLLELRDYTVKIDKTFPSSALRKINEITPDISLRKEKISVKKPVESKRVEDILSEKLYEIEKRLNALR